MVGGAPNCRLKNVGRADGYYKYVKQATSQVAASGGRPIVWIFAEEEAAIFARDVFDDTNDLKRITVGYVPWTRSGRNRIDQ